MASPWTIEFSSSAAKELLRLERSTRERILESLEWLSSRPRSAVLDIKRLQAALPLYRLRVGDYRVVYELVDRRLVVYVVRVRHRKDVYRGM
jgi:mRNA interferase RelE/StbE